jgi:hypothetical protein
MKSVTQKGTITTAPLSGVRVLEPLWHAPQPGYDDVAPDLRPTAGNARRTASMREFSSGSHPAVTAAEDHVLMHAWWKWLIAAAVVVPLVAYVTGSLVAARSVPTQREPIMIMVDPSSSTTTPAPTPTPRPSRTPSPTPSSPSPSPEVERGPETVRPSPHDLDDDEPDELDDDEADDRTDDETEDDD